MIFLYLQLQLSLLRQCSNNAHSEYTNTLLRHNNNNNNNIFIIRTHMQWYKI